MPEPIKLADIEVGTKVMLQQTNKDSSKNPEVWTIAHLKGEKEGRIFLKNNNEQYMSCSKNKKVFPC